MRRIPNLNAIASIAIAIGIGIGIGIEGLEQTRDVDDRSIVNIAGACDIQGGYRGFGVDRGKSDITNGEGDAITGLVLKLAFGVGIARVSGGAVHSEKAKVFQAMRPLRPDDVVRGQYVGYRKEPGVAKHSDVETFCALRLFIDSWRWEGVPWYLRSGKCLAATAAEVIVELKPPPQRLFDDSAPADGRANYLRFRLSPNSAVALAARVKRVGKEFIGDQRELYLLEEQMGEETPYARLLSDAMAGNGALFTREDAVEAAWTVVDPVLERHHRVHAYKPGSWGPKQADALIAAEGNWHNPILEKVTK